MDVKTNNQPTTRTTPTLTTVILTSHDEEPYRDETKSFNYRQVIRKPSYLEKSTRPDKACALHQCARFCANPKTKHAKALKQIGRYLLSNEDKGLIMKTRVDWSVGLTQHMHLNGATRQPALTQVQHGQGWDMS